MTPIEAAADHAVHGTHPGRLAAVHHALGAADDALTFAREAMETVAADPRLDKLIEVAVEAQRAGVADEVFAAATDALHAARIRKNGHAA